jgi:hypothetical protein
MRHWVRFAIGARSKRRDFGVSELKSRFCVGFDWVRFARMRRNAPVGSYCAFDCDPDKCPGTECRALRDAVRVGVSHGLVMAQLLPSMLRDCRNVITKVQRALESARVAAGNLGFQI